MIMDKNDINALKAAYNSNIKVAANRMASVKVFNGKIMRIKEEVSDITKLAYKDSYRLEILFILKKSSDNKRIKLL